MLQTSLAAAPAMLFAGTAARLVALLIGLAASAD
jgi:hypothetical protein